jgi:hypothetical protein
MLQGKMKQSVGTIKYLQLRKRQFSQNVKVIVL